MSADYIGAHINLVSNSNIRYEGVLKAVDTVKSTVVLENVRVMGTEGRNGGVSETPASTGVIPVVSFSANDIKDLHVSEEKPSNSAVPPGVNVSQTNTGGWPNASLPQQQQYPPQMNANHQLQQPPGNFGMMGQQGMMPPSNMAMDQQQMAAYMQFMQQQQQAYFQQQQQYVRAMQMQQQQQQQNSQPRQRQAPLETRAPTSAVPTSKGTATTDTTATAKHTTKETDGATAKRVNSPRDAQSDTVVVPAIVPKNAAAPVEQSVDGSRPPGGLLGAVPSDKKVAVGQGGRRGAGGRTRRKQDFPTGIVNPESMGKSKDKYTTEFDFDASNKQFNKDDVAAELSAELSAVSLKPSATSTDAEADADAHVDENADGEGEGDEGDDSSFYSPSSFFDNISCDASDRAQRKRMTRKETIEKEKSQNLDTFGVTGYDYNNRRPRYNNSRNRNNNTNNQNSYNYNSTGNWRQGGSNGQSRSGNWRDRNANGRGSNSWGRDGGDNEGKWRDGRGRRQQNQPFQAATAGVQPFKDGILSTPDL